MMTITHEDEVGSKIQFAKQRNEKVEKRRKKQKEDITKINRKL
jgi:hypothetical protein